MDHGQHLPALFSSGSGWALPMGGSSRSGGRRDSLDISLLPIFPSSLCDYSSCQAAPLHCYLSRGSVNITSSSIPFFLGVVITSHWGHHHPGLSPLPKATGMCSVRRRSMHSAQTLGCPGETYSLCFQPDSSLVTQVQAC